MPGSGGGAGLGVEPASWSARSAEPATQSAWRRSSPNESNAPAVARASSWAEDKPGAAGEVGDVGERRLGAGGHDALGHVEADAADRVEAEAYGVAAVAAVGQGRVG